MNPTDNEIIKALECCGKGFGNCEGCPYDNDNNDCVTNDGKTLIFQDTLDLLNRQKAEIEYLQKEYIPEIARATKLTDELAFEEMKKTARLQEENKRYKHSISLLEKDVQTAKSEAIKEFAERLKDVPSINIAGQEHYVIVETYFDNLVNEMENANG